MLKIIQSFTLTQYVNKGAYGKVYKAINHDTQQSVAIKMISLQKFTQNPKLIELTKQQVEILSIVEHNPNIIKLKQIIKSNRFLYMVYEYCQGGTLEEYLIKSGNNKDRLTEKQAILIFKQLINAYKSLHENNIVHRDIKTDNIFFKDGKLKLADFGFSKKLKYQDDLMQTSLGSPLYMAPQVLNNDVYGSKADLWSCGVILYQMLFNRMPYQTANIKQLLQHYSNKSQPTIPIPSTSFSTSTNISPTLTKMLQRILTKDQFRRISWQQFLYQYQFNDNGQIIHRQRDFEYDLMKLMKRNSSGQGRDIQCKSVGSVNINGGVNNKLKRFDWSTVTEMNSSAVHSQECQGQHLHQQKQNVYEKEYEQVYAKDYEQVYAKDYEHMQQQQQQQRLRLSSPLLYNNYHNNNKNIINNHNHHPQNTHNNILSLKHIQSSNHNQPNQLMHYPSQHNISLQQSHSQQQINYKITAIYNIKKMIKHFQHEHTKILQVLLIIEQLLQSDKQHVCDLRVCYFLMYNLQWLLEKNLKHISSYIKQNNSTLLSTLKQQHNKLQKLQRLFFTQLQTNKTKINSIKTLLLGVNNMQLGMEVFKYPKNKCMVKKVMKEYVQMYEVENQGILGLLISKDQENNISVDKSQQLRLLRVLWAVLLVQQQNNENNNNKQQKNNNNGKNKNSINKFNPYSSLPIKQQTTTQQLSVLINRYLIQLGI